MWLTSSPSLSKESLTIHARHRMNTKVSTSSSPITNNVQLSSTLINVTNRTVVNGQALHVHSKLTLNPASLRTP